MCYAHEWSVHPHPLSTEYHPYRSSSRRYILFLMDERCPVEDEVSSMLGVLGQGAALVGLSFKLPLPRALARSALRSTPRSIAPGCGNHGNVSLQNLALPCVYVHLFLSAFGWVLRRKSWLGFHSDLSEAELGFRWRTCPPALTNYASLFYLVLMKCIILIAESVQLSGGFTMSFRVFFDLHQEWIVSFRRGFIGSCLGEFGFDSYTGFGC